MDSFDNPTQIINQENISNKRRQKRTFKVTSISKKHTKTTKIIKNILVERFDYQFTPWAEIRELVVVYNFLYDSIRIDEANQQLNSAFSDYSFLQRTFNINNNVADIQHKLQFVHERICDWKLRCHNIGSHQRSSQQFLLQHLIAIESMVNILLEEFKPKMMILEDVPKMTNSSLLYNLYSIGVINFCNVLSSYSKENNILSIMNLARILKCPAWIVECRHDLSHPCSNPPSMQTLSNAITFGLRWMEEYFWKKSISFELRIRLSTTEPIPLNDNDQCRQRQEHEYYQAYHDSCFFLFNLLCPRKRASYLIKQIQRYMNHNPNAYVGIIAQILIFDVPKHSQKNSINISPGLIERSSRLFKVIFSLVPEHSLLLLLNLIIDSILDLQLSKSETPEFANNLTKCSIRMGYMWLVQILSTLIRPNDEKKTQFEKTFLVFSDLVKLKRENQFLWNRLFYKLLKLRPNHFLIRLTKILYENFINDVDHILISKRKYKQILNLLEIFVDGEPSSVSELKEIKTSENVNKKINTIKDIEDQISNRMELSHSEIVSKNHDWERIFMGATIINHKGTTI